MNSSLNCLHLLGFSPISNLKSRTDLEIPLLYELSGIQSVPPSCGEISWILYTHSLLPQSESYLKLFPAFFITTCVLTHHSLTATALLTCSIRLSCTLYPYHFSNARILWCRNFNLESKLPAFLTCTVLSRVCPLVHSKFSCADQCLLVVYLHTVSNQC